MGWLRRVGGDGGDSGWWFARLIQLDLLAAKPQTFGSWGVAGHDQPVPVALEKQTASSEWPSSARTPRWRRDHALCSERSKMLQPDFRTLRELESYDNRGIKRRCSLTMLGNRQSAEQQREMLGLFADHLVERHRELLGSATSKELLPHGTEPRGQERKRGVCRNLTRTIDVVP